MEMINRSKLMQLVCSGRQLFKRCCVARNPVLHLLQRVCHVCCDGAAGITHRHKVAGVLRPAVVGEGGLLMSRQAIDQSAGVAKISQAVGMPPARLQVDILAALQCSIVPPTARRMCATDPVPHPQPTTIRSV